jgi:hypothetical protein
MGTGKSKKTGFQVLHELPSYLNIDVIIQLLRYPFLSGRIEWTACCSWLGIPTKNDFALQQRRQKRLDPAQAIAIVGQFRHIRIISRLAHAR